MTMSTRSEGNLTA